MEERLAAYRAKKAQESGSSRSSGGVLGTGLFARSRNTSTSSSSMSEPQNEGRENLKNINDSSRSTPGTCDENVASTMEDHNCVNSGAPLIIPDSFVGRLIPTSNPFQLALQAVLWCALFGIFICLGFGAIFFIISLFYVIYANMRGEGEKKPGEKSAYSVFNPDCERIHGTLTAEQIEKGMLYGIGGAVR